MIEHYSVLDRIEHDGAICDVMCDTRSVQRCGYIHSISFRSIFWIVTQPPTVFDYLECSFFHLTGDSANLIVYNISDIMVNVPAYVYFKYAACTISLYD